MTDYGRLPIDRHRMDERSPAILGAGERFIARTRLHLRASGHAPSTLEEWTDELTDLPDHWGVDPTTVDRHGVWLHVKNTAGELWIHVWRPS